MEAVDAVRVLGESDHKAAATRGPVIALLCVGTNIHQACTSVSVPLQCMTQFFYTYLSLTIFSCFVKLVKKLLTVEYSF